MKKRNKIIAGCASVFAVVSVATVGFATWLVGVTQKSVGLGVVTQVDSVQNETQYVEAKVTEGTKITVAEKAAHVREGKNIIGASENDSSSVIKVDANALSFSFESITVRIGDNATTPPTKVVITLDDEKSTVNQVKENKMGTEYRSALTGSPDYWTYLRLDPVTLTLAGNFTAQDNGSYTTYTLKDDSKKIELGWGTFFNKTNPVVYYNNLVSDETFEELLAMSDNASAELTKMNDVLTGDEETPAKLTFNIALQA